MQQDRADCGNDATQRDPPRYVLMAALGCYSQTHQTPHSEGLVIVRSPAVNEGIEVALRRVFYDDFVVSDDLPDDLQALLSKLH